MKYFLLLSTLFLLFGCSIKQPKNVKDSEVTQLATLLKTMDKNISTKEAQRLSRDIFLYTAKLAKKFDLVSPPQFHNFLVNVGIRQKGLCYHWSDALYLHLSQKEYPGFAFHLVGANIGEYWSEHNALVVVSKSGLLENGIVIDPWRNSGILYFSRVMEDTSYQWKHRKERCK